jgi:hypothetical protein
MERTILILVDVKETLLVMGCLEVFDRMRACRDNAGANPAANLNDLVGPSSNYQDIPVSHPALASRSIQNRTTEI